MICVLTLAVSAGGTVVAAGTGNATRNVAVTPGGAQADQSPTLAKDPTRPGHLAIGYHNAFGGSLHTCYVALSSDDGRTWRNVAVAGAGTPYPAPPGFDRCRLPAVSYGADGTLYYAFDFTEGFAFGQVYFTASRDGRSFSPPRPLDPGASQSNPETGGGAYFPGIVAGNRRGVVYVGWDRYNADFNRGDVRLVVSRDNGRTFSVPTRVNPASQTYVTGRAVPALDRSGRLYVSWIDGTAIKFAMGNVPNGPGVVDVASSRNGGRTFEAPHIVGQVATGCHTSDRGFPKNILAAGPAAGKVYVAWSAGTCGGRTRVFISSSQDSGNHWRQPRMVMPRGSHARDQFRPWLAVAPHGRVDLDFYDADAITAGTVDVFVTSSANFGASFTLPVRLDSVSSHGDIGPFFAAPLGQNLGLASSDGAIYAAWNDNRRGSVASATEDVFSAKLTVPAPR